ncbi:hypothetical protein AKJ16_DCAP07640, partial [Drosera capensis]
MPDVEKPWSMGLLIHAASDYVIRFCSANIGAASLFPKPLTGCRLLRTYTVCIGFYGQGSK